MKNLNPHHTIHMNLDNLENIENRKLNFCLKMQDKAQKNTE